MSDKRFFRWSLVIFGLLSVGLFSCLGLMELRFEEPRRALVSMLMMAENQYIVPELYGWPYYNKPPVYNWILVAFFQIFQSFDEWVVRLPGVISYILCAFANYLIVRKEVGERVAIMSSLLLLTAVDILYFASVVAGEIDLFYMLICYLQFISIYVFLRGKKWWPLFLISFFLAAVGFLTKGLPSIVHQVFTLVAVGWAFGKYRWLIHPAHLAGWGIFLGLTGIYFWAYNQRGEADLYLLNLIFESADKSAVGESFWSMVGSLFYFPVQFIYISLPGSALLFYLFRKNRWHELWKDPMTRFCLVFIAANVWIYWISPGTRNRYLYIFFPFLFILAAELYFRYSKFSVKFVFYILLILALGRISYNFFVQPYQQEVFHYRQGALESLEIIGERSVDLTIPYDTVVMKIPLPLIDTSRTRMLGPGYFPYHLPYYLLREGGKVMHFTRQPERGKLYWTYKEHILDSNATLLYEIEREGEAKELWLVEY